MKLERHVGGLGIARQKNYLVARGWSEVDGRWTHALHGDHPRSKALHHQLTSDLTEALSRSGWQVLGYSPRGYAQLRDGEYGDTCSLPKALRLQAKRENRKVGELTYTLFLDAVLKSERGAD